MSDPDSCLDIGIAAAHAGLLVHTAAALGKAAKAEEPVGYRTLLLGMTLHEIGDFDGAEQALRAVVAAGQPDSVGAAAYLLGLIHSRRDQEEQALEDYALAAQSDDPKVAPRAMWELALGLLRADRIAEMIEPLQRAAASEDPDVAPRANLLLAVIAADRGDPNSAVDLWQQVLNADDDVVADLARSSLSDFTATKAEVERLAEDVLDKLARAAQLVQRHHFDGAVQLCLQVQAEDPARTAEVQRTLGDVYQAQGRISHAVAAYEASMAAGTSESSGTAALNLGVLHMDHTQDEQAGVRAFEFALASDDADVQAKAAVDLGLFARRHGDASLAVSYFQRAQAIGDPRITAKAALNIADILEEGGAGLDDLAVHYRTAIATGDPESSRRPR
jgi:tetratricopeptide (TPR) repeat protein